MREHLTELEGAILSEIHHCGSDTAFAVSRAFRKSPSLEWRGSAGAVYPAIKRLIAGGRLMAVPRNDGRKSSVLKLTSDGLAALHTWVQDADRATSPGIDPFRLRSGIWSMMPPQQRNETLNAIAAKLIEHIAVDSVAEPFANPVEEERRQVALGQQRARLEWVQAQQKRKPTRRL